MQATIEEKSNREDNSQSEPERRDESGEGSRLESCYFLGRHSLSHPLAVREVVDHLDSLHGD